MEGFESKKLALLRIMQILNEHSDYDHPLKQGDSPENRTTSDEMDIAKYLERDYGIIIDRKTISRNISRLQEAGIEIEHRNDPGIGKIGYYMSGRDFEESELRLLIDSVLGSRHITAKHSKDLIDKLCGLSSKYFQSHVKYIHSVDDWNKSDNQDLFYNIEVIDSAIEQKLCIQYDYYRTGIDKKLHRSSTQIVSPYQMILNNQRYYLMARSERWGDVTYHRLDHIRNIKLTDKKATPIESVPGYERGIDYKKLSSSLPYMFSDTPVRIKFLADTGIIDHVIDWFGKEARLMKLADDETKVEVSVVASPEAMKHWALQYIEYVEVLSPESLRANIRDIITAATEKYGK